jgi:hypothetical protein
MVLGPASVSHQGLELTNARESKALSMPDIIGASLPSQDVAAGSGSQIVLKFSSPETRFRIWMGLFVVLVSFGFSFYQGGLLADPDTWWHIRVGSDIWQTWRFPRIDTYSYTFVGHPWIAKEWGGQIIMYLAYALAGWNGVWYLGTASITLLGIAIYATVSRHLKPLIAAIATIAALLMTGNFYLVRPFLFGMPIMVLWTYWLFEAARLKQGPHSALLILLVLWANLHSFFTLGFLIAFFAFLEFVERTRLQDRVGLIKWVVFGLLCPVVCLLNPYTYQAILATYFDMGPNEAVPFISEWFPFNAQWAIPQEVGLLAMLFLLMGSGAKFSLSRSLFLTLLLHLFFIHIRFATIVFPLLPAVIAAPLAEQFPGLSAALWRREPRDLAERIVDRWFKPLAAGAAVAIAVMSAALLVFLPVKHEKPRGSGAIAYAKEHHLTGHVMNAYEFGGPLIFNHIPTFIDGRSDQLFQGGFAVAQDKMQKVGGESLFLDALKKYDITWTLFSPKDPRVAILDGLKTWKRAYTDDYAVIHVPVVGQP